MTSVPFRFPRLTPTVRTLLVVLAASFVALALVQSLAGIDLFGFLALDLGFAGGYASLAWQPLTYWLVYPPRADELVDLAFLLLGLYFFLSPFEEGFGAKRTLQLSAVGVLASAAASIALALVLHAIEPAPFSYRIFGPSPILLAALGAFPVVAGNREILFMFVIPMKAWTLIALGLGIAALLAVMAKDPFVFVQHAAALGAGVGFAKWVTRPRRPVKKPPQSRRRSSGPDLKVVKGGQEESKPRWLN